MSYCFDREEISKIVKEAKNECNEHDWIYDSGVTRLISSPPIDVRFRICSHCGELQETKTYYKNKTQFQKLFKQFHDNGGNK